jgi:hypothetical protein
MNRRRARPEEQQMPSAAQALFPHLKSGDQAPKQQQRAQPSLASAMYPRQSVEARRWDAQRARDKEQLLKALRAANDKTDARLRRERER